MKQPTTFHCHIHDNLPCYVYDIRAADELTKLYTMWICARRIAISMAGSWYKATQDPFCRLFVRACDRHRRRFLKAFAKRHTPETEIIWGFGLAAFYTYSVKNRSDLATVINFPRIYRDKYRQHRYWRQHIPNLP